MGNKNNYTGGLYLGVVLYTNCLFGTWISWPLYKGGLYSGVAVTGTVDLGESAKRSEFTMAAVSGSVYSSAL